MATALHIFMHEYRIFTGEYHIFMHEYHIFICAEVKEKIKRKALKEKNKRIFALALKCSRGCS